MKYGNGGIGKQKRGGNAQCVGVKKRRGSMVGNGAREGQMDAGEGFWGKREGWLRGTEAGES